MRAVPCGATSAASPRDLLPMNSGPGVLRALRTLFAPNSPRLGLALGALTDVRRCVGQTGGGGEL